MAKLLLLAAVLTLAASPHGHSRHHRVSTGTFFTSDGFTLLDT
jgi:hypothetical protein